MGLVFLFFILIFVFLFVFLFAVWMACGMLPIFLRPDRLRPPWWDWGLDKVADRAEAEPVRVVEEPVVVEPEAIVKHAHPRW